MTRPRVLRLHRPPRVRVEAARALTNLSRPRRRTTLWMGMARFPVSPRLVVTPRYYLPHPGRTLVAVVVPAQWVVSLDTQSREGAKARSRPLSTIRP